MPQVPAYDFRGAKGEPATLPDDWFAERVSEGALYQALRTYLANQRQGTASTRTRGEVMGSGAKPWRQKGTGRARAGTRTSPIWRGGGTTFGPTPRDYRQRLPRQVARLALRSAFRLKLDRNAVFAFELESFERPQTGRLARALDGLPGEREVLLLTAGYDENLFLSGRNIPGLTMKQFKDVTAYEVLRHSLVLVDPRAASQSGAEEGTADSELEKLEPGGVREDEQVERPAQAGAESEPGAMRGGRGGQSHRARSRAARGSARPAKAATGERQGAAKRAKTTRAPKRSGAKRSTGTGRGPAKAAAKKSAGSRPAKRGGSKKKGR